MQYILSQNAPVCTQDIFWFVVCERVPLTDISIIEASPYKMQPI